MTDMINNYVDNFLKSIYHTKYKLPLIAFTEEDCNKIKQILGKSKVKTIKKEENIRLNCKHFPYTCDEVQFEHISNNYKLCNKYMMCRCKHTYHEGCRVGIMIYKTYIKFGKRCKYMTRDSNCYDDCCCYSKVLNRYLIYI